MPRFRSRMLRVAMVAAVLYASKGGSGQGPLDAILGPEPAPRPTAKDASPAPPTTPEPVVKVPVPAASRIQQATALVQEAFQELYENLDDRKAGAAGELVSRMLTAAAATKEADRRFALLNECQRLAAKAGMVNRAFEVTDRKIEVFEVDAIEERSAVLKTLVTTAGLDVDKLFDPAVDLVSEAIEDGRLDEAEAALQTADEIAKSVGLLDKQRAAEVLAKSNGRENPPAARAPELVERVRGYRKVVAAHRESFARHEAAARVLKVEPDSPSANADSGAYLCFCRDEWTTGLPYLEKSDRAALRTAARLDRAIGDAPTSAELLAAAGAWWEVAREEGRSEVEAVAILGRAANLYSMSMPGLEDPVDQALAGTRIQEANERKAGIVGKGGIQKIGIRLPRGEYRLEAWCDDRAEVYVNGAPALQRVGMKWQTTTIQVPADGAVRIAAKCTNTGGPALFMLILRDQDGKIVASTAPKQGLWRSYIPPNPQEWWRTDNLRELDSVPRYKGGIWAHGAVRECFLCLKAL